MPNKGENALVAWLAERFPPDPDRVRVGIGDDMAVLSVVGGVIAITSDMLLDGVHFDTARHDLQLVGRKSIACSLSDCAAMACNPLAATVSIALPDRLTLEDVQRLYEGMAGVADRFGCRIVGGDTTSWSGRLAIDVAMLAEPMSPRAPILRSTARAGDTLFVSGPLGGSLLGRHLTFTPRIELARRLANHDGLHAMMDLSDGLSMDLHRMCEASRCDAELEAVLLEAAVSDAARSGASGPAGPEVDAPDAAPLSDAMRRALNDGEDFELLIAGPPTLLDVAGDLIPVGRMIPRDPAGLARVSLMMPDTERRPVEPRGYEHFR